MRRFLSVALMMLLLLMTGCGTVQEYSGMEISDPWVGVSSEATSSQPVESSVPYSTGADYVSTGTINPLTGQSNLPTYMARTRQGSVVINH